jgi:S-DNA-T family DNA segregation ATPase FtsK/SpoIIIE
MARKRSSRKQKSQSEFVFRPEVLGLMLLGLSLLTLLSLFSATRGDLTDGLISFLEQMVGWGRFIIWFFFGVLGLWFIRRYGVEDDDEKWEKPIGTLLLLAILLTVFQLISPLEDPIATDNPGGGGIVGWILGQLLVEALGLAGSAVVLSILFILAVVLISGLSLRELSVLIRDLYERFQDWRHFRKLPINQPMPEYLPPQRRSKVGTSVLSRLRPSKKALKGPKEETLLINDEVSLSDRNTSLIPTSRQLETYQDRSAQASGSTDVPMSAGPVVDTEGNRKWHLPIISEILEDTSEVEISEAEIRQRVHIIEETLASFGVEVKVREINQGPAVTQFSVEPGYMATRDAKGNLRKVRVSRIVNLTNDLALALAAAPIRIEAPIPGRPYVGIEVPNISKTIVTLRSIMESPVFQQRAGILKIGLGRNVAGKPVVVDLTAMPHLLIAGATGSGKSVCINAIVSCLLCTHTPDTLRLLMIDPKMVELVNYNGIPHLLAPVVTELERVIGVLNWATREMDRRYKEFSKAGARNIASYNQKVAKEGEEKLPYIVIIIDELADLMMMAPDDVERAVTRIAQMARATGIHLILATQRPSVDVVTGLIKANFPARVAFAVSSQVDSRVILDMPGAERLLGKGDMLYMAPDAAKLQRLQGVHVSDAELERIIKFWGGGLDFFRPSLGPVIPPGPLEQKPLLPEFAPPQSKQGPTDEELLEQAIEVIKKHERASISLLQRQLRIGYARAARLIDELEEQGIIGPDEGGGQARQVFNLDTEDDESS